MAGSDMTHHDRKWHYLVTCSVEMTEASSRERPHTEICTGEANSLQMKHITYKEGEDEAGMIVRSGQKFNYFE